MFDLKANFRRLRDNNATMSSFDKSTKVFICPESITRTEKALGFFVATKRETKVIYWQTVQSFKHNFSFNGIA